MSETETPKPPTLFRVFAAPVRPGHCRGCNASISWYQTIALKAMPVNVNARPQKTEIDVVTGRRVAYFSTADSHWATCPERAKFQKR